MWYCMYFYKVEYTVKLYFVLFKKWLVWFVPMFKLKDLRRVKNAVKNFSKLFQCCTILVCCYFIALLQIALSREWCYIVVCLLTRSMQKVRAVFVTHIATFLCEMNVEIHCC
jgi:hypothetical protein